MAQLFSKKELYSIRNDISICELISNGLQITCQENGGLFKFQCPECNGFSTGVKKEANISRCFQCDKQFNTIEITMAALKLKFIDSVTFLQKFKNNPAHKSQKQKDTQAKDQHDSIIIDRILCLEKNVSVLTGYFDMLRRNIDQMKCQISQL